MENDDRKLENELKEALKLKAEIFGGKSNKKEWNAIMEDSSNQIRTTKISSRVLAIAASVLVMAVLAGLFASSNSGGEVKTVSDQKIQKTPEIKDPKSELLEGTVTIQKIDGKFKVFDSNTNKFLYSLPDNATDVNVATKVEINSIDNGRLTMSRYLKCFIPSGISSIQLKTGKETFTDLVLRSYSPSGNRYFELVRNCDNTPVSAFLVDVKTGDKKEFKPAAYATQSFDFDLNSTVEEEQFEYVVAAKWISETEVSIGSKRTEGVGDTAYRYVEIDKVASAKEMFEDTETFSSDEIERLLSVQRFGNEIYVLRLTYQLEDEKAELYVTKLNSTEKVWTKEVDFSDFAIAEFGSNQNIVYGAISDKAFAYDARTDLLVTPNAIAVFKK